MEGNKTPQQVEVSDDCNSPTEDEYKEGKPDLPKDTENAENLDLPKPPFQTKDIPKPGPSDDAKKPISRYRIWNKTPATPPEADVQQSTETPAVTPLRYKIWSKNNSAPQELANKPKDTKDSDGSEGLGTTCGEERVPYYRKAMKKIGNAMGDVLPSISSKASEDPKEKNSNRDLEKYPNKQVTRYTLPKSVVPPRLAFSPDAQLALWVQGSLAEASSNQMDSPQGFSTRRPPSSSQHSRSREPSGERDRKVSLAPGMKPCLGPEKTRPVLPPGQPPAEAVRRPYWQLNTLGRTIKSGGFLNPRLHVPKEAWFQEETKLNGLGHKVAAFEELLAFLVENFDPLPDPEMATAENLKHIEGTLKGFCSFAAELQNSLARPFPFIPEVEVREETANPQHYFGWNKVVSNIGKKASTAMERFGASLSEKVKDSELKYYSDLISEVCTRCQVFETWNVFCLHTAKEKSKCCDADQTQSSEKVSCLEDGLLFQLHHVAFFFKDVVLELIVRDFEAVLEQYLQQTYRSMIDISMDEDV